MKTLLAGWFSFEQMGATAGDLLARDVAVDWLRQAGHTVVVAVAPPFSDGVDWRIEDPTRYDTLVFVCGPCGNGWPLTELLERFGHCRRIGLNVSMLQPLEEWNPFDVLVERDSSRTARPEWAFVSSAPAVPVIGLIRVHPQLEYADGRHEVADLALDRLLTARPMAILPIDTRLDINATGLRSAAEVESLVAKVDVVVTTRLHGMVLALKHGVPVVAVDPIAGGAKVKRQADVIGWPHCYLADRLDDRALSDALGFCLRAEARMAARACAERARIRLTELQRELVGRLRRSEHTR